MSDLRSFKRICSAIKWEQISESLSGVSPSSLYCVSEDSGESAWMHRFA